MFHCASPAPASDDRALFQKVNVDGTRIVIQACQERGVQVGGTVSLAFFYLSITVEESLCTQILVTGETHNKEAFASTSDFTDNKLRWKISVSDCFRNWF